MKLALLAFASVVLLAPGCTSAESETSKAEQRARELEGHALLDDYVGIMRVIASSSSKPSDDPFAEHELPPEASRRRPRFHAVDQNRTLPGRT